MEKLLPSNVAWFEKLMYLSLGIGAIVSLLQWNYNVARADPFGGPALVLFVQMGVVAFMVLFIWLIARRHKNWARWVFLITGISGLPFYIPTLGQLLRDSPVAAILSVAQLLAEAVAFLLVFTGNARAWFRQSAQPY